MLSVLRTIKVHDPWQILAGSKLEDLPFGARQLGRQTNSLGRHPAEKFREMTF